MNADVLVDTAPPALLACLFEICDEGVELRLVLDAGERHFVARNELVRVGEILLECFLVPADVSRLQRRRIVVVGETAGLAAEDAVQGRADAVLVRLERVAALAS